MEFRLPWQFDSKDDKQRGMGDGGEHFVLVHGACHGAWCWYKLAPLLKSFGHRVTALDMGASGVDPTRLDQLASLHDYVRPLMEFMANSINPDQKVVLVGHSYGGFPISMAMERFPHKILVSIFVAAYMPSYTSPLTQAQEFFINRCKPESLLDSELSFGRGVNSLPTAVKFGPEFLSLALYQHAQPEDVELAKSLMRPHRMFLEDLEDEGLLSKEKFGSVDRVYVVLEKDAIVKEDFQRWVIEDNPPKQVKFIPGADHMVMISNPKDLSLCLLDILHHYI